MADEPSDSELLATLQASVDADTLTDAAYEATHQALYQVRKRLYERKTATTQQSQRITALEAENASLRANSFAAAVEACRLHHDELGGDNSFEAAHYRIVADWLSRQASQGAQQRKSSPTLEDGTQDPASWEAHEAGRAVTGVRIHSRGA